MKQIIIPVGIIIAIIIVIVYTDTSNSVLGHLFEQFYEPNWDEVKERNIVKNSIPISLLEKTGEKCIASAENFEYITNHEYFIRSQDLIRELQYDKENKTIVIPCDEFSDEKLTLHVWYATEESLKHSKKYEYYITPIKDKE